MYDLAGFHKIDQLYTGNRTLVYRAVRIADRQPVIVKVLRNLYPSFNELVRFRNQYAIACNLEHPAIVRPCALETYGNRYALVMPDDGAIALSDYWQISSRSLVEFCAIAIQLAEALNYLAQQSIVHKDIKPANILIHPETHQVRLIDFSIATLLPREQQQLTNPNVLEGTLAYISPEQTGRTNRRIDYRTDFYALGVTFFELLTGKLPFETDDPMELVHCHIARPVEFPERSLPAVPEALQNIALKLMAKNAEERYQSSLGLKHDLEKCLHALNAVGAIAYFELGAQDICDRFLIPEKLYGRETEVQTLLDAFFRVAGGTTEILLVAGFSGIGKTAVVNEVHKPIVERRGYFIKGKYDQFDRNIPFSAFVQAFRDLMGQLLGESDAELAAWKAKILAAVGDNGQVLINAIPELERIVGKQPPAPELSGSAAQNRFNLLFGKFVRVFTTQEHPLVIFLDDLQWADSASLNLLKLLVDASGAGYLLVLGAYRDNEVFPTHSLMRTLDEIRERGVGINTLTLAPLSEANIHLLVADTLLCSTEIAAPFARSIYQKTQGNPFFINQFLKGLYADGWIVFNPPQSPPSEGESKGGWQCDLARVRQLALTDDVVEFMVGRLQKLPEATRDVLKLAAYIGNRFDLATLAVACEANQEKIAKDLWRSLQEGLVVPESETYKFFQGSDGLRPAGDDRDRQRLGEVTVNYRFLHDRVQQSAYLLVPASQRQSTHLKIGRLLLESAPEAKREEKIFDIVNHLNIALEFIYQPAERERLARFNLLALCKAKAATAYTAAETYATAGIELLAADCWENRYDLALSLYKLATEVSYLNGDFDRMEARAEVVFKKARSILDKTKIYEIKITAYASQNRLREGIEIGLQALKRLGITFPETPDALDLQRGLEEVAFDLTGKNPAAIADLPQMTDPEKLAAIGVLSSLFAPVYISIPELMPLLVIEKVKLSVRYGNSPWSAFAYGVYGVILCGIVGDIESGYQFGKLAASLLEQFNEKAIQARTLDMVEGFVIHWKEPARKSLEPLRWGYQCGVASGEFEWAGYTAFKICQYSLLIGEELTSLKREMAVWSQDLRRLQQDMGVNLVEVTRQAAANLVGESEDPCRLVGEAIDEERLLPVYLASNNGYGLHYLYLNKLILCYLFEEFEPALNHSDRAAEYLGAVTAALAIPVFYFYDSLARLAMCRHGARSEQQNIWEKVTANQEKMLTWSHHAPMNYLHKFDLVEAEKYRVLDKKIEAIERYDRAIAGARENEYIQEEAIANELAAKFYLDWGKEKIAATYMQEAYYCYARWGAKAKTERLEEKYPQLLAPIVGGSEPLPSLGYPQTIDQYSQTFDQSLGTVAAKAYNLDLAAAIETSRAISEEIELDALLSKLMRIVLENAGATKGTFILNNSGTWETVAQCDRGNCHLSTIPLERTSTLPRSIINTVRRTQQTAIANHIERDPTFAGDPYLLQQPPKSLCCIPILKQGRLIGILYLENQLTAEAFTPNRIEALNLLAAQAAISIENARLYQRLEDYSHNLEVKVEQRTQELQQKNQHLQQTFQELQRTQGQLIQAEKMSGLGQMVAGVAHEINNPISFIAGNINHAREYVRDLLDLIALYERYVPHPHPAVRDKVAELDLAFLYEDLERLFDSMQTGSDRIRKIILNLRNFARLDEAEKKQVDIHEGLENTLMFLQHRLQARDERAEIAILKNYGNLPPVHCYASQLNQVFLNILTNAIDALDLSNSGDRPEIHIATEMQDARTVRIRIADNGPGMDEDVRQRIFDPFFTTKPVGRGTGLGLSIGYQIVTEQHGGQLRCTSQLGAGTVFIADIPVM